MNVRLYLIIPQFAVFYVPALEGELISRRESAAIKQRTLTIIWFFRILAKDRVALGSREADGSPVRTEKV